MCIYSFVGTMIFRDRGKRTENTESTLGNGKRIFKRRNTEMYFYQPVARKSAINLIRFKEKRMISHLFTQ